MYCDFPSVLWHC